MRNNKNRVFVWLLGAVALVGILALGLRYALAPEVIPISDAYLSSLSSEPDAGFERALEPREFRFPEDHGAHEMFKTEWWYFTGNLRSADGRRWGYQLTFFRQALAAPPLVRTSAWATNNVYLAHFTVSNIDAGQFSAFEQLVRGGDVGLAGSDAQNIFIGNWQLQAQADSFTLTAAEADIAIAFDLQALKPATLQGINGLSAKDKNSDNASYYYSFTRLATTGTITVAGESVAVEGLSWFDHEWSTSSLSEGQVGWQWYGLHLDDGRDVMWGELRRADGSVDYAIGSITGSASSSEQKPQLTTIEKADAQLTVLDTWKSPATGVEYPSQWRLHIPEEAIDITITPFLNQQELRLQSATYWEGAVRIEGSVTGSGYVELTGYGRSSQQLR